MLDIIASYYIELIGVLGFFILGLALFSKTDVNAKTLLCVSCIISAVYFILLGMYISAAMMLFSSLRVLTSLVTQSKMIGIFFIILSIILPFIIPSVDWVSALTGVTGTIGLFWFSGVYSYVL
ncbi:hypothetical protein PBI_SCTP2_211 [Salicola phage SCTP-2]|nr:hypothetical protein PBI_SCTP2_211 [Salicola phage SCTP-2]